MQGLALALALPVVAISMISSEAAAQSGVVLGAYECWFFSRAQPGLNFTLLGGGQYADVEGKRGTVALDSGTRQLTFKGGALDGESPLYEVRNGTPTVSFQRRGSEAAFCEGPRGNR